MVRHIDNNGNVTIIKIICGEFKFFIKSYLKRQFKSYTVNLKVFFFNFIKKINHDNKIIFSN